MLSISFPSEQSDPVANMRFAQPGGLRRLTDWLTDSTFGGHRLSFRFSVGLELQQGIYDTLRNSIRLQRNSCCSNTAFMVIYDEFILKHCLSEHSLV